MFPVVYKSSYQRSWALIIGINLYQNIAPLSYACNDASALKEALVQELDFQDDHVTVLKDGSATKQAILSNFLEYVEKADNPDDRLLVFYAGHGMTLSGLNGPVGYLVPVDGNPKDLSSLIRWDELTRNAELIKAKHILFIMDACYSGLATQRTLTPGTERFLSDMLQRVSRQVITAGKADQVVADGGGPKGENSIFTGCMLEGLRGAAADASGVITANGLMFYVYQNVGQSSQSRQTPHYGHIYGDGDFVLRTPNKEHLEFQNSPDFLIKTVQEIPESPEVSIPVVVRPTFVEQNGYSDPSYSSFGRNDWSRRLGEVRYSVDHTFEASKAFSWLSLIIEPVMEQAISVDLAQEASRLPQLNLSSQQLYECFSLPGKLLTTMNSLVLFDQLSHNSDFWKRYLRIDRFGNIEYADSRYVFDEIKGIRFFYYGQIVGIVWQFIFLARKLLVDLGYEAGVRLLFSLVGTRDSVLTDFSQEPGENGQTWRSPTQSSFGQYDLLDLKCPDSNLQLEYKLALGSTQEAQIQKIAVDVAKKLSLAYNHQSSPRCFNYNTEIFPWQQYFTTKQHIA